MDEKLLLSVFVVAALLIAYFLQRDGQPQKKSHNRRASYLWEEVMWSEGKGEITNARYLLKEIIESTPADCSENRRARRRIRQYF